MAPPTSTPDVHALCELVECCETAVDVALVDTPRHGVLPGVAIDEPRAVLKLYLTFLACVPVGGEDHEATSAWLAECDPAVLRVCGFTTTPSTSALEMAFALLGRREHQAAELRALIAAVPCLAAARLLRVVE